MQFTRRGEYEVVTKVSGPLHHVLGLRFVHDQKDPDGSLVVQDLASSVSFEQAGTPPKETIVVAEVGTALDAAKQRLGIQLGISGIQYCSKDPYVTNIYHELAGRLIERVSSGMSDGTPSPSVAVAAPVERG